MTAKDDEDEGGGGPVIIDPKRVRLAKLWDEWRHEVGIVALGLILWGAWYVIPYLDPRAGFDGWSDILYALLACAKMLAVTIGAWASAKACHFMLPDADEKDLLARGASGNRAALMVTVRDAAIVLAWAVLWFFGLFVL